jgi:hypothetical protein
MMTWSTMLSAAEMDYATAAQSSDKEKVDTALR